MSSTIDIATSALAKLLHQFAGATRLQALARAWLAELQELEDALQDVLAINLDNATGNALDQYGALVGIDRGGRSDSLLRTLIKGRIAANNSEGRVEDLHRLTRALFGPDAIGVYQEHPPAKFSYDLSAQPLGALSPLAILELFLLAKPGGVGMPNLVVAYTSDPFTLASDTDLVESGANGLGWSGNASLGGTLVEDIT